MYTLQWKNWQGQWQNLEGEFWYFFRSAAKAAAIRSSNTGKYVPYWRVIRKRDRMIMMTIIREFPITQEKA